MTRNDLIIALIGAGLYRGQWLLDDDEYAAVSVQFISEAYPAWLDSLPVRLTTRRDIGGGKMVRAPLWVPESGDCDNIARWFGGFLSLCMAADAVASGKPRGNIAAGKFNFSPTASSGHAINWFVDHEGRAHHFDAGSNQMDHLTPLQLSTISAGESA